MTMYADKLQALGVKQETTQSTPVVPSTSTDYVYVDEINWDAKFDEIIRDYARSTHDSLPSVIGKRRVNLKVTLDLRGSGTRGDKTIAGFAGLDALIQACKYTSTAVASTSITYGLTSVAASSNFFGPGKSVTIEAYRGGKKHIIAGCLGTWSLSSDPGKFPKITFDMSGIYAGPSEASVPSPTIVNVQAPVWESSTISIMGFGSARLGPFSLEQGNTVTEIEDPAVATAIAGFVITKMEPKGKVIMLVDTISNFDPFTKLLAGTLASTSIVYGSTAGNIITFTMPKTQITDIKYTKKDEMTAYELSIAPRVNTGDDSISIVIT